VRHSQQFVRLRPRLKSAGNLAKRHASMADTISLAAFRTSHEALNFTMMETEISWASDRQRKFRPVPLQARAVSGPPSTRKTISSVTLM